MRVPILFMVLLVLPTACSTRPDAASVKQIPASTPAVQTDDDAALVAECHFRRLRKENIEPDPTWDANTLRLYEGALTVVKIDYMMRPGELEPLIQRDIEEGRITKEMLDLMLSVPWCQEDES